MCTGDAICEVEEKASWYYTVIMKKIGFFETPLPVTPVMRLNGKYGGNTVFMKRDDLMPFSFGGNKVRKAAEFYHVIKEAGADVIMTYGTDKSNHCRVVAQMAAAAGVRCHVISPENGSGTENGSPSTGSGTADESFNARIVKQCGAVVEYAPLEKISEAISHRETAYRQEGLRPFFIKGGGHGLPGTLAYVKAYAEILTQEEILGLKFDRIFLASGTGCTQAGLVCGEMIAAAAAGKNKRTSRVVGISIARENPRGRDVVEEAVRVFMGQCPEIRFPKITEKNLIFDDSFIAGGYGKTTPQMQALINDVMVNEGVPLDETYTGKAFYGMTKYLENNGISGKKILFIHTGGTPLWFNE